MKNANPRTNPAPSVRVIPSEARDLGSCLRQQSTRLGQAASSLASRGMAVRMPVRKLAQTLLLLAAVFALAGAGDPASRFSEIGHQMMCICGCNQILLECNHVGCPASDGMRTELMAAVTRGDSDSLVEQCFVQKYGPTVLAAPTAQRLRPRRLYRSFRRAVCSVSV